MYILLIIFQLFNFASAATNKPYESYEEIVDRLSNYRSQKISTDLQTSVPTEKFHVMLGLANTSTKIADSGMGSVSHTGFGIGAAFPLIEKQLFVEIAGKFFKSVDDGALSSGLQQYEAKINHKEPLTFGILNVGAGMSARFLTLNTPDNQVDYRIPSLLLTTGLERRLTSRISLGGELGYHRSLKDDPNGKNTLELGFKFNYNL